MLLKQSLIFSYYPPGMSNLLKSQAVALPETKNQQGRTFDETYCVHTCICEKATK